MPGYADANLGPHSWFINISTLCEQLRVSLPSLIVRFGGGKTKMGSRALAALATFVLLVLSSLGQAQTATCNGWQTFKRIDLRKDTIPLGINNLGIVVGATGSFFQGTTPPALTRYSDGLITIFRYQELRTTC